MEQFVIVGVDVSKATLDVFIRPAMTYSQIKNETAGFKILRRRLKKIAEDKSVLVVMEHTGRYSYRFEKYLRKQGIGYCKIAALQIKRSIGLTRGKSDKIDAERIADYGWMKRDILKADEATRDKIRELQSLLSYRAKLVRDRSGYVARLKEILATQTLTANMEIKSQKQLIKTFGEQIKKVEEGIAELIRSDEAIAQTDRLLQSIKGVGPVVSAYMISRTCNFTKFSNARKFNCYAGLAPFKYESGTSIRGRSRVSHLANKEAKTVLNLAAFSAIRYNPELKQYYQRRLENGKAKMSSVNVVRSKLVARMFAVVKRQTPYQQQLAA
jgi:transposase